MPVIYWRHSDAIWHRADDLAEIAANAFRLVNMGNARVLLRMDALVGAVVTCGDAELAADALVGVDLCHRLIVHVKVTPLRVGGNGFADHLINTIETMRAHVLLQPVRHVFHNVVATQHHFSGNLHRAGSK